MHKRELLFAALACVGAAALPMAARAQADYPNRPVKVIVPFPVGGTSDLMGRIIAEELGKNIKKWAYIPFCVFICCI